MRVKVASLRSELAEVLRIARTQPVTVMRHIDPVAVIISTADFEELQRLRSMYRTVHKRGQHALAFS